MLGTSRLIARPLENRLKSVTGVKNIRSTSSLSYARIFLEFEVGFDINLEVSLGEAPSKKTDTVMKGSCTFGDAAIGISCLAYEPAIITIKAINKVVLAFFKAKSIMPVINGL